VATLEQERITKTGEIDVQMDFEILKERLSVGKNRAPQQSLQTSKRR
jgi:hypothetical protein